MRHKKNGRRLNRNAAHRNSMFRNMICSFIMYEKLKTTLPKAKELRSIVEPMITCAKIDNVSNRRLMFSKVRSNKIIAKLFGELSIRFAARNGGYTRILKCNSRIGDRAPMAYIEFVEKVINTK